MDEKEMEELEKRLKKQKADRNYNFFRPVGQFIEHVDTINFSMDKDGNFHFENVGQVNGELLNQTGAKTDPKKDGKDNGEPMKELFKFIHPAITGDEERNIHKQVKKLVTRQGIQEICKYLTKLESEEKIYLPQSADTAYTELVRMGMPSGDGFSIKTFMKYYKK